MHVFYCIQTCVILRFDLVKSPRAVDGCGWWGYKYNYSITISISLQFKKKLMSGLQTTLQMQG